MSEIIVSEQMPVLALRGLVVFPKQLLHFDVGREKSLKALESAMLADQRVFLVTQKNIIDDDPTEKQLYPVGTVAKIKQILRMQDNLTRILVEGEYRAKIERVLQTEPCMTARVESVQERTPAQLTPKAEAMMREASMLFDEYLELMQKPARELQLRILASRDLGYIADTILQHSTIAYQDTARLLGNLNPVSRLEETLRLLRRELEVLRLESEIGRAHV